MREKNTDTRADKRGKSRGVKIWQGREDIKKVCPEAKMLKLNCIEWVQVYSVQVLNTLETWREAYPQKVKWAISRHSKWD